MIDTTLPRVTYSNIGTDFSALHTFLDTEIPAASARLLGQRRSSRIDRKAISGGKSVRAVSPIDRDIVLAEQDHAGPEVVHAAVNAA